MSGLPLVGKVCDMQYNSQTFDKIKYKWNNYNVNNWKSVRVGSINKQACLLFS